jgi:hypothetical protein
VSSIDDAGVETWTDIADSVFGTAGAMEYITSFNKASIAVTLD